MGSKILNLVFLVIIVVLTTLLLLQKFSKDNAPSVTYGIIKVDTILVRDTIRIWSKARVRYKTIIKEKIVPNDSRSVLDKRDDTTTWIACIDTTINKTSINCCYFHPKNYFSITIYTTPDTIVKYLTLPSVERRKEDKNIWYYDVLKVTSGFLFGFLLGKLR